MAALILSAAVWAVICPPGWGAEALVVADAFVPPLLSWWVGAHATAQAAATAKQVGLNTDSEIMMRS